MGKPSDEPSSLSREPSTSEGVIDVSQDEIISKYGTTQRGLSNRHLQLMVIASSIGTGLFVGIGSALRTAGPLSVLLAYLIYPTIFILPCSMGVAEMATHLPIRGSIYEFASRYVDPAFGFALGWTYFFASAMLFCTELSAVVTVMGYWQIDVNPAVWVAMALVVCVFLNLFAVKWYGESEFIFSCTKILLLIGLLLLTLITMCGGNPKHWAYGFHNWSNGEVMHEYMAEGAKGRFLGFWSIMIYAAFSIAGPDFIALSAAEMKNPRRNIPRCARATFLRIFLFYVLGSLAVGILCDSKDPRLLAALGDASVGSAASPWVIGIENLGIHGLAGFINVLILISGWSCGNAMLYSSSRTLYSLAMSGHAPKFLLKCTKSGNPIYCVGVVSAISLITFLVATTDGATVFGWFVGLSTCGFVLSYTAMHAQGVSRDTLHWKAPFMPYGAYIGTVFGCIILLFLGFDTFKPFSVSGFITSYFGIAYMAVVYTFWKIFKRDKFVKAREADLWSGKEGVDQQCMRWEGQSSDKEKNWLHRIWSAIW
ncbi:amino acid permease/ SLC12A domain-containing protein [Dactylonectria macrodidyma]|uniref:Amino acid permease/ SLC12A domain-containing protein n=1 Tax=Dactylonectria macrodidyma TaxID=307937 RepID=A0A9P9E1Q3_9HYPO|nr:amino acid permease/ SLC12A domain-containing protein [Dactylonectria macrodidyma]